MPTCEEIRANYKAQHDTLSESYYAGTSGLTKEEFDTQHGAIWNAMEAELIAQGCISPPNGNPTNYTHPTFTASGGNANTRLTAIETFLESL